MTPVAAVVVQGERSVAGMGSLPTGCGLELDGFVGASACLPGVHTPKPFHQGASGTIQDVEANAGLQRRGVRISRP